MSELRDLINGVVSADALPPVSATGTTQGAAVDLNNGEISTGALVNVGAFSGTSVNVQIEECATTNGTFTAIAGMICTITSTTPALFVLRGFRKLRYARANVATFSGTSALLCVDILSQMKLTQAGGYDRSPST